MYIYVFLEETKIHIFVAVNEKNIRLLNAYNIYK